MSRALIFVLTLFALPIFAGEDNSLWRASDATSHRSREVTGIGIGETKVVTELTGPAVINHIWITVKCAVPQVQGLLTLKVYWDDEPEPSIEVPLGDFFGVGYGKERVFKSALLEMYPAGGEMHSALNCYWKMPFRKSARIEIENRSFSTVSMFFIQVDYEKRASLPDDTLYFHAQYRRENPVALHEPYTILEATGRGKYVGTIMNYHLLGPGAWVEGGQSFYIDGETTPSLPGTGAEDYFGHAWGFRTEQNGFYHGTSFGPDDGKMTAYRFHIPDPVHFTKSIRATMRCHGWDVGDRQDDYSSIALWYQTEPHASFPPLPPVDFDLLEVPERFRHNPLDLIEQAMQRLPFKGKNLALEVKDYRESGHFDIDGWGDRAFDGDYGTKWCEIDNPDAHWLALDLKSVCKVEGCVIVTPSAIGDSVDYDVSVFEIEKGNSLEDSWQKITSRDFTKSPDARSEFARGIIPVVFDKPVKTRFLRFSISKSCPVDPICRIQEFQVWGKK